jgi:cytochrome c oxidase subunit 1
LDHISSLSALPKAIGGSGLGMTLWLISMAIFISSSLMGSLNYIVTVINLRTKGMSMTRIPDSLGFLRDSYYWCCLPFRVLLSAALLLILTEVLGPPFLIRYLFGCEFCIIKVVRQYYLNIYFGFRTS